MFQATGISHQLLRQSNLSVTTEPFFHSVLMTVYHRQLDQLKTQSRIGIPADRGRSMMGVVDETGQLGYGQVFVQYSRDIKRPGLNPIVHTGKVKNYISSMGCLLTNIINPFCISI